jgi:hypothetical protein
LFNLFEAKKRLLHLVSLRGWTPESILPSIPVHQRESLLAACDLTRSWFCPSTVFSVTCGLGGSLQYIVDGDGELSDVIVNAATNTSKSIGLFLQQARISLGIDVNVIAAAIRMDVRDYLAIEANELELSVNELAAILCVLPIDVTSLLSPYAVNSPNYLFFQEWSLGENSRAKNDCCKSCAYDTCQMQRRSCGLANWLRDMFGTNTQGAPDEADEDLDDGLYMDMEDVMDFCPVCTTMYDEEGEPVCDCDQDDFYSGPSTDPRDEFGEFHEDDDSIFS